ncbi:MAG: LamG-like jellyroll fold domain-containing protein [Planctomycetota bacterium]
MRFSMIVLKQSFLILIGISCLVTQTSAACFQDPTNKTREHDHHDGIMTTRATTKTLPLPKSEDCFHFIIYGDRTGGVPEGIQVLKQAVNDTNLLDPDLVMTVGDLIQGYNETPQWMDQMKEYKQVMGNLEMNWFPVAGNHDVYWRGKGKAPQGQHDSNYETHFGPLWYSFRHKNTGFIVLYSDEGDPKTNQKSFNRGNLQNMSTEQLEFLDKALAEYKDADHVMVFLHHPRWIGGGYEGCNWDDVHQRLKDAGNVSAVFAGHIHRMRYSPKDGIQYYALATTGGSLATQFPSAGYLHHFNIVTVRKNKVSVAAIPVGSVINPKDFTKEFLAEIDVARSIRPKLVSKLPTLTPTGKVEGTVTVELTNPCPRDIQCTLAFAAPTTDRNWTSSLGHQHVKLSAGATQKFEFSVRRASGNPELASLPKIVFDAEYLGESSRIKIPESATRLNLLLGQIPANHFQGAVNQCADISSKGSSAIVVKSDQFKLPDGPVTVEAWVKPKSLDGYNAIIAKTQGSEYALFSDEGVPQFDIHLNGKYVTAKAKQKMVVDRWTHLAGVYDGEQVKMYVDGKLVGTVAGNGKRRTNALPLLIGADPDLGGRATRPLPAFIDEVRISKSARYEDNFEPAKRFAPETDTVLLMHLDRNIGPFALDHSESSAKGILGSDSKLVPAQR